MCQIILGVLTVAIIIAIYSYIDPNKPHYFDDDCPRCEGQGDITDAFGIYTCPKCGNTGKLSQ